MSTVTRRRVGGQSANSDDDTPNDSSQHHHQQQQHSSSSPMADKKVAYDPRDIDESKSTPKLTLMEEVLLLGLKDKQVSTRWTLSVCQLGSETRVFACV